MLEISYRSPDGRRFAIAVMIGDTSFDMLMARNAEVDGIGVAWGHHPASALTAAGAVAVARDFAELSRLLDARLRA